MRQAFKRHSGVPLAPKDLRSSYIMWLRSDANTDAVLKSAAFPMGHSTAQQAGPAYDKERSSRLSLTTVQQSQAYAARSCEAHEAAEGRTRSSKNAESTFRFLSVRQLKKDGRGPLGAFAKGRWRAFAKSSRPPISHKLKNSCSGPIRAIRQSVLGTPRCATSL